MIGLDSILCLKPLMLNCRVVSRPHSSCLRPQGLGCHYAQSGDNLLCHAEQPGIHLASMPRLYIGQTMIAAVTFVFVSVHPL